MKKIYLILLFYLLGSTRSECYELRAKISAVENICLQLQNCGALFCGDYAFTDYCYYFPDRALDFNKEFIRLRIYQKTNWDQKNCVITHKIKEEIGKSGRLIWHLECDSCEQAQQILENDGVIFFFSFFRHGYEYILNGMRIFVEDIQGLPPTIEVIGDDLPAISELFNQFHAEIVYDSAAQLVLKQQRIIHE